MNELDNFIARTQRNLSYVDRVLFAVVIGGLMLSPFIPKPFDEWLQNILLIMVGALIGQVTQQNQFWYMRQRSTGIPDPSVTTVKQVTEVTTTPTPDKPEGEL